MVSDLKTFVHKGCKIAGAKKVCYRFFYLFTPFKCFLPPLPEVQCPNFLEFRNPWGKVMERIGLRFENLKGVQLPRKKCYFFCRILTYYLDFFGIGTRGSAKEHVLCFKCHRKYYNGSTTEKIYSVGIAFWNF